LKVGKALAKVKGKGSGCELGYEQRTEAEQRFYCVRSEVILALTLERWKSTHPIASQQRLYASRLVSYRVNSSTVACKYYLATIVPLAPQFLL
jgi:hypothetical protein